MDIDRKILRAGTVAIVCALLLRLMSSAGAATVVRALGQSEIGTVLVFLNTGRLVRQADIQAASPPEDTSGQDEVTVPAAPEIQKNPAVFTGADPQLVQINNEAGYDVDVEALLQETATWDLTQDGPAVLILHTHGSESYTKTEDYTESSDYRTLDAGYNVVSVGDRIQECLEAAGIQVLHDQTLHDYPSYNGSYEQSRKSLQAYLAEYPTIRLVLDIHRDAAEDASGNQISYTVETEKGTAAKLMLVVGTDAGGLYHPNWRENLALAAKLQVQLEKSCSGICRPVSLRTSRFNQDLSPGAVLVEVGAAGNTRQQALIAAEYLAQSIISLAYGTIYE